MIFLRNYKSRILIFSVINNFIVQYRKCWKLKNKFIIRNYLLHLINMFHIINGIMSQ